MRLLEQLLQCYEAYFDIERPFTDGGVLYDAYAYCEVKNAKYALVKSAQLWSACTYEHVFFQEMDKLSCEKLKDWQRRLRDQIEPEFVRRGCKCPPPDHMCTYLTNVFISQQALDSELIRQIRRHRFHLNYRFALRGYCESRLAVFDLEKGQVYGNGAARALVRKYKKIDSGRRK